MRILILIVIPGLLLASGRTIGNESELAPKTTVINDLDGEITIDFEIPDYNVEELIVNGKTCLRITLPETPNYLLKGLPDLPMINRAVIIPSNGHMAIEVIDQEIEVIKTKTIAPSKGNLPRTIDPQFVPYKFGDFYNQNEWFPKKTVELQEPFILRDYRGISVQFNPFQYNPRTNELKITKKMKIRVYQDGPGQINVKIKDRAISREFQPIYENVFLNYKERSRWDTIDEHAGRIFIITADQYYDEMQPYVEWKLQKGFKVKICSLSTIGNNQTNIANAIQNEYDSPDGLTFAVLVGDGNEVYPARGTVGSASGEDADPVYAYCEGGDYYPDIIVARLSSNSGNANNITKQIDRAKYYELTPMAGADWYHVGLVVGSAQGSPADSTRLNWQRDSLLNYTYTEVNKSYDYWGTTALIKQYIEQGVSIINYMGHGSTSGWSNGGGFDIGDINGLNNPWMLPFVISVACVVGNFNGAQCYCEASVVAGTVSQPDGFLVHWGSSISQSWVPPTIGQMGAVRMLVNDKSNTAGGYMFNGACYMIQYYGGGSEGVEMAQTWHIFGDPSVQIRTDTPVDLTVNHAPQIDKGSTQFAVEVVGVEDALCAIYYPDSTRLYGSGYTDATGNVTIQFSDTLNVTGEVVLTVTAYNKTPYVDTIPIIAPGVETETNPIRTTFSISKNPASRFEISYAVGTPNNVRISLYDCQGRLVRTVESSFKKPGYYSAKIDNRHLANGIYFLKFQAGDYTRNEKLILIR